MVTDDSTGLPVALFAGSIQPIPGSGRPSAIFKRPVAGPVRVTRQGLAGDHQADRSVHGGPDKALHHYPAAHYARLAGHRPQAASLLIPGSMGENISTAGLTEADACIGDVFELGTAVVQICQPRRPCWKIDARFGVDGLTAFVAATGCTGWYYRVLEEGEACPGDLLRRVSRGAEGLTLTELWATMHAHRPALDDLARAAHAGALAAGMADKLKERLAWLKAHQ